MVAEENESVTIADRLARIETKLDNVLKRDDDHEKRIRWLERIGLFVVLITGGVGFDIIQGYIQAGTNG